MNTKQLYIPDEIKIGFQDRSDTYTKRLGYVIYKDHTNVWRKEGSWKSWRDDKIDPLEVKNEPTRGFVLNKGVKRYETNRSLVRVWDPRGFEFEVSIPNLLFILTESDCGKKGLEGEFVYSWDGKDLILLPTCSEEYKSSKKYTDLQSKKVSTKEYKPGATYLLKDQTKVIYLGRFLYVDYDSNRYWRSRSETSRHKQYVSSKKHIFCTESGSITLPSTTQVKEEISTTTPNNFATWVDNFTKSKYASPPAKLITKEAEIPTLNKVVNRSRITYNWNTFISMDKDGNTSEYGWHVDSKYDSTLQQYTYTEGELLKRYTWKMEVSPKELTFSRYHENNKKSEWYHYRNYNNNYLAVKLEEEFPDGKIHVPYLVFTNGAEEEIKGYR